MGAQGTSGQGSYPTGLGSTNISGSPAQGTTVLTVASTAGLAVGQTVVIDQHNAAYVDTTGVEGPCTSGNSCGRNDSPLQFNGAASRAQQEMVLITNVNSGSNQITIDAPGLGHDYTSGLIPQVFFWNTPNNPQYAGVENINVNANNNDRAVSFPFCDYCWIKNVEIDNTARAGVFFFWGYRDEVRDSYITGSNGSGASTHYGIELLETTFVKGENNIIFGVVDPWMTEGSYGTVVSYNYQLRTAADNQFASINTHLSHSWDQLREGNSGSTSQYDDSWGSASQMTDFRNYMNGKEPNATNYRSASSLQALNLYDNLVANVFGDPTYHINYQCDNTNVIGSDNYIYDLGFFNGCVNGSLTNYDTVVVSSLMRWGNWDSVTWCANGGHTGTACSTTGSNGVRYCTGSGAGNPACTVSETANSDPTFPGLASPATVFMASFYSGVTATHASCGTGLSFWKNPSSGTCPTYPPIGPDVTCSTNCVSNTASHVAKIPAQLCYDNTAKNGSGYLTAFDANACYANDPSVSASANLQGSIKAAGAVVLK